MVSVSRRTTMPTVIQTKHYPVQKELRVGFDHDPVTSVSRPVNTAESWAAYNFETHAQKCAYCHNPYEVHRSHEQLCEVGHRLAQDVTKFIYQNSEGETCSTLKEESKVVRVEIPAGYDQVRGLLKAIERSLRHRSRTPFVSMDRTYYVAPRVPERTRSVKIEQAPKTKSRPRSGEIVDWPEKPTKARITTEVSNSKTPKRGSLYEQDLMERRRNAPKYNVEVREPSVRDIREHRLSGYYR